MISTTEHFPVGVVGLGASGTATVRFLAQRGMTVLAWDRCAAATQAIAPLPGVTVLPTRLPFRAFRHCQAILLSPGVPRTLPELEDPTTVPILNDVEWLFRHVRTERLSTPFVGITGTNGKSTVTTLVGDMLMASGMRVAVGGNLGPPALSLWDRKASAYVLELSSFQLESIEEFHPHVTALLNISPDHLDRYATTEAYLKAKCRLFTRQSAGDWAVINADDPMLTACMARLQASPVGVVPFSIQHPTPGGVYVHHGTLFDHRGAHPVALCDADRFKMAGRCNLANAAAATAIALAVGASSEAVVEVLMRFPGLPHRVAWVRTLRGVSYYNDSKGTNVGAVLQSLPSFPGKVWLIAGGRDKKGDFAPLAPLLRAHAAGLIVMGEAAMTMAATLQDTVPVHTVATLSDAVSLAHRLAQPGETVLLSPACASFDMFRNFEERGNHFEGQVHAL